MIRDAESTDLTALCALNDSVQALHVAHRPEFFRPARRAELATYFQQLLESAVAKVWVSEREGAVDGYLVGIVRTQAPGPYVLGRTWFELDQIDVAPESRQSGVGRSLIEHGVAFARARGIDSVELSSWSFNRDAQRAFQKLGFVPKVVRFEYRP